MGKEEPGCSPVSPVAGHPVPPRAARLSGDHPVRGVPDRRESSHPHDDVHEDTVAATARKRSPISGRRGRTPVLFSLVTPFIIMSMAFLTGYAVKHCPYSDEGLDLAVLFTSLYSGTLITIVFVNDRVQRKEGDDENR